MALRARRRFEALELRIAPSDTLVLIGAAIAAAQTETMLIAPPKPVEPRHAWAPEKMEVALPTTPIAAPPKANGRPEPEPIDQLFRDELDLSHSTKMSEKLGPDIEMEAPTSPRPAAPLSLGIGTSPSPAPGSGSGGSAGAGGGGGGGGSHSPSQALTGTTDVVHAAAPAPNTSSTVSPMDFGPVANDDYYQVAHDDVVSDNVLTNDSGFGTVYLDSLPTLGTVSMDQGGGFTYQAGYHNSGADSFTYHFIDDTTGESSNIATVTIDILEHPPQANDDYYTLTHDMPFGTDFSNGVLVNDFDPDPQMETMTASLVTGPAEGTLVLRSDGTFDYTPTNGEIYVDAFTYRNTDALGESSDATVTLDVVDPNRPVALNDGIDPNGNVIWQTGWRKADAVQSSYSDNVLVNQYGTDYDNDPMDTITPVLDSYPANGNVILGKAANGSWDGTFTYIPTVGFSGIDTFTYQADDGALYSLAATVYIRVQKVDLDLYDGGHPDASGGYVPGDVVPDDKELTRGGYAVANWNDTNGDGSSDNAEQPV